MAASRHHFRENSFATVKPMRAWRVPACWREACRPLSPTKSCVWAIMPSPCWMHTKWAWTETVFLNWKWVLPTPTTAIFQLSPPARRMVASFRLVRSSHPLSSWVRHPVKQWRLTTTTTSLARVCQIKDTGSQQRCWQVRHLNPAYLLLRAPGWWASAARDLTEQRGSIGLALSWRRPQAPNSWSRSRRRRNRSRFLTIFSRPNKLK